MSDPRQELMEALYDLVDRAPDAAQDKLKAAMDAYKSSRPNFRRILNRSMVLAEMWEALYEPVEMRQAMEKEIEEETGINVKA